ISAAGKREGFVVRNWAHATILFICNEAKKYAAARATSGIIEVAASSTAANGMHDFDPVAFDQYCRGMQAARHNVAIEFDRQPAPSQFQTLQQIGHRLTVR